MYGNGSTSNIKLIGTIQLVVFNPHYEFSSVSLNNVAYDAQCGSNLLSAYYLAKQGYRHSLSKSGDFLFLFGPTNKFMFAAVAIGEVYYLPTVKYVMRKKCFTVKQYTHIEKEKTLKEWHLRLGHVGKEQLIRLMANQAFDSLPCIPYNVLKKVPFCCRTCAIAKSRRMSYSGVLNRLRHLQCRI